MDTAPRRAIGARTSHPLPFLFSPNSLLCLLRSVRALSLSLPVLPPLFFPSPITLRQVAPAALPLSLLFSFQKRKATTPQRASRNAHLATRISQRAFCNEHLATRISQRAFHRQRAFCNAHFATRISTCDTQCAFCEAQLGSERSERRPGGEGLRAARTYLKKGERSEHCDDELDERRRRRGRKGEGWRAARCAAHLASAECDDQRHGRASAASAAVTNKSKGGGRREGKGEGLRASSR